MGYRIPEHPQQSGPFEEQHGYADLHVQTHNYDGNPSPINPSTHHNPSSFEKFAKNENTKKAGSFILGQLRNFICS